ncbi:glycosyl hydrolase family 28-related protein [Janthinobacterium sp.]|uniref:glycosyl hydrolase family 28-related protein n=1 Tax=Janthinobacterium sp. TaxID=1871054 RepID=UPI00293D65B2|nr:glycosyl hydrolase family 28-related protein [Janthinobacterium sp.]
MKITPYISLASALCLGAPAFAAAAITSPAVSVVAAAPPTRVSVVSEEFIGPFPSWGNVKTKYGAKGDGIADDTDALQRAIDDMNLMVLNVNNWTIEKVGSPAVIYLPAGTYRITRTLKQRNNYGASIVGQDPATTKIVWAGPAGGAMLVADGVFGGKYARLTWDGKGTAGIGVAHWWNRKTPQHGASPEHIDEVFTDMGVGIVGGCCGKSSTAISHPADGWVVTEYGDVDSEGTVRRTKFIRNSVAGVSVESANALDWWVTDSEFTDCYQGVTNALGSGNVLSYRNLFQRSKFADIHVQSPQWHSMHGNVSVGSRRFLEADMAGKNGGAMILKNNRVLNSSNPTTVFLGNLGPLILIDNEFLSTATSLGPVVQQDNWTPGRDVISVGNKFSIANQITIPNVIDRVMSLQDTKVAATSISLALPVMPATPKSMNRTVFEVPLTINPKTLTNDTSAAAIQAVINQAAASLDPNPIVHFPRSNYTINTTLVVPAGRRIQLAGDSIATILKAGSGLGSNPIMRLNGPSLATVRDLRFLSNDLTATALTITAADQAGGRIVMSGNMSGVMNLNNLLSTRFEAQGNPGIKGINANAAANIMSVGAGNIGPVALNNKSNLLMADTWFEGAKGDTLVKGNGASFSYLGGHMAPPDYDMQGLTAGPAIVVDNFAGMFTVVGLSFNMKRPEQGILIKQELANTKALFLGVTGNVADYYYKRTNTGGTVGFSMMKTERTKQVGNTGATDSATVLSGLAQIRSMSWDRTPAVIPAGATDVLLYRIRTFDTKVGLEVNGK